jgi:hypothetical protein
VEKDYLIVDIKLLFKAVMTVGLHTYPTDKLYLFIKLCTSKYMSWNEVQHLWTLVECTVKNVVENSTFVPRKLTALLPIMHVMSIEICAVDPQIHTGKICLWYIVY